ncbi:MAG: M16 family metallopeptidase [Limisphaerales bacterium]
MKITILSHLFVRAVSLCAVLAVLPPARGQTASPPALLKIAPLKYRQRTLANGLTVLSIENHQSPTVAIQVWYHVGGKDDPAGRSGFAHLFEHMMFKSTTNQKSENFDRLTEDVGGANNAFTQEDATVYHETVPANYLETLLWAEADRMANLKVDEANFVSERAVVEEEYRQSVLANPYGRLELYVDQSSFVAHPYKHGVIGSIADLDSATLEDVRRFHDTFYRPDNATLIVSGDFDPDQLDLWVDKYFARISKPATAIPRVAVVEPARTKEARFNTTGPNVPLPATVITYLLPPRKSDDADAVRVAEVILARGKSSRMNQSLVYRQQIAANARADADLRDDAGLFDVTVITAGGKSAPDAEKAALAELAMLATEPVTAAELEKARNLLLSDVLRARETAEGQAFALGEAAVSFGDPERVNTDIARLQAVTAADVLRVAQKYFTTENRVIIRYENGKEEQGGQSNAPKASPAPASAAFTPKETPPAPGPLRPFNLPTPMEKKLPNGVRVVIIPRPGTGLVSVSAGVKAGSVFDPAHAAGLADFTASLLTRGTKKHTAPQIAETVEAMGGSLSSTASWDGASVSLSSLSSRLGDILPTFAEVLRSPAFAAEEIERLRSENLDHLTVSLRSPGTLARLTAARVVFGESSYGHSPTGTPETIKALDASEMNLFYEHCYQPENTVLVFGGDITPDAAFAYASENFGDWKRLPKAGLPAPAAAVAQKAGRVVVVDKPDAGQAAVYFARPSIRRADEDYAVGRVANGVLGEGFSSRLNQEVRIKRGLSYGAGSSLGARKDGGLFYASAQTRNDTAPEVAILLNAELTRLATEPVAPAELVPRKAALSGNYTRALETGAGLVSAVVSLADYDLPLAALNDYLPQIQRVTPSQIQLFARKNLTAAEASVIIVGDGRQFLAALKKQFPNAEVIPVDKLDLNKANLANLVRP